MSIKTMIKKWLGIEPQKKRISASRAYQAPIHNTYQPTMQRLPFEKVQSKNKFKRTMPISKIAPRTAEELYRACGGYDVFKEILRHANWYSIRCDDRNDGFTHTIRILNRNNRTNKGFFESKTMRVHTKELGELVAARLLDIHAIEIRKRQSH